MPSIYTPDPTNIAQPADSDYAYIQAGELRAIKQYLAAQLTGLGGPVNPEVLRDRSKNYIVNGCCRLAQEGAVAIATNGRYYGGCDLIFVQPSGFSTVTGVIQQYTNQGGSTGYAQGVQLTTTGSGLVYLGQRLEALNTMVLGGRTITISCYVAHNTGNAYSARLILTKAGAINDFSAETNLALGSSVVVNNNTYTLLSLTYTPTAAEVANGLGVYIEFAGVGVLSAKDFLLRDFQLVESNFVTPFTCQDISQVYAEVGRFLEFGEDRDSVWLNTTDFYDRGFQTFKYRKWAAPTVTIINSASGAANSIRDLSAVADRAVTGIGATVTGMAFVTTGSGTINGVGRWKFKATAYL